MSSVRLGNELLLLFVLLCSDADMFVAGCWVVARAGESSTTAPKQALAKRHMAKTNPEGHMARTYIYTIVV